MSELTFALLTAGGVGFVAGIVYVHALDALIMRLLDDE
jgi:hypothetical protein